MCLFAANRSFGSPVKFDIPAQPASAALQAFARQAGMEVLFPFDELKKIQAKEVKGELEPAAALKQLLEGTGYESTRTAAKNFVVKKAEASATTGAVKGSLTGDGGKGLPNVLVTIRETTQSAETDKFGQYVFPNVAAGTYVLVASAPGYQTLHITDVAVKAGRDLTLGKEEMRKAAEGALALEPFVVHADAIEELEKFEVTGQKGLPFAGARIDVERTRDDILPFSTFNAQDITLSGAANLEDFLRMRLPQNFSALIPEERNGNLSLISGNFNNVVFRGWVTPEILYLVNGRRLPVQRMAGDVDANPITGNFRGIPLGSIERVEVLSEAGSAMYGAGATSGVVNIITRQDYRGGQLTLNYENPLDAHAPKRTADFTYGMPLKAGLSLRVGLGYSESQPLNLEDRADVTTDRWNRLIMARAPARITGQFTPALGATPNITASAPLFGPGTPNFTSVPDGYAGGQGITPFLTRQGIYNLALSDGTGNFDNSYSRQSTLGAHSWDKNLSLGLDQRLGDNWRLSLEFRYAAGKITGPGSNLLVFLTVPVAAPSNPFGQSVRVALDDPRFNRPELFRRILTWSRELSVTLRGNTGEWQELFDLTATRDRNTRVAKNFNSPPGDLNATNSARWSNAIQAGLYNPFVDVRTTAPAAPDFYDNYIMQLDNLASGATNYQASAKAAGPWGRLPAGPVHWTVGVEWQREDRDLAFSQQSFLDSKTRALLTPATGGDLPTNLFTFDNYAAYGETTVPVLSSAQKVPLVRKLDVFASGRFGRQVEDGFRTDGKPVDYRTSPYLYALGLRYTVADGVMLRASRSLGYKPPQLAQVAPADAPVNNSTVIDRRRNNQSTILAPAQYSNGGNPDLIPESTDSENIGLVLEPRQLKGFRFSADFVETIRDNAITSLALQNVVDLELDPAMAGRVQRAAPEPGAPNGVGLITFIDGRMINLRQTRSKSLDFTLEQSFENIIGGRLVLTAAATKNLSLKIQTTATGLPIEQVRNPATASFSQTLQWNANGQVRWEGRAWTFGWSARYFDSILVNPADVVAQGSDRASWALEHDAFVSHRFARQDRPHGLAGMLSDTSLTLGVRNVFNRGPRFWAAANGLGYVTVDSIYGRSVWLQLRRNF